MTLQVVDVSSAGAPHPAAKALYFTVNDLDAIFERAKGSSVFLRKKCTANRVAASASVLGASVRFTRKISGTIHSVSLKRNPLSELNRFTFFKGWQSYPTITIILRFT